MTKRKECGFKVIRKGSRSSIFSWWGYKGLLSGIIYEKRRVVKPKPWCGPLAVFKTKEEAKAFVNNDLCSSSAVKIVSCLYVPAKTKKLYYTNTNKFRSNCFCTPLGTGYALSVTCLE